MMRSAWGLLLTAPPLLLGLVGCEATIGDGVPEHLKPLPPLRGQSPQESPPPADRFVTHTNARPSRFLGAAEPPLDAAAAQALAGIGAPATPALVRLLGDPDPRLRKTAARALGRIGAEASPATPALTVALQDPDDEVRAAAAKALGEIGPAAAGAVPDLINVLRESSVPTQ